MTNNEARERIAEAVCINCIKFGCNVCYSSKTNCKFAKSIADALLAEGVIVPKFKVGQKVWGVFWGLEEGELHYYVCSSLVCSIRMHRTGIEYATDDNFRLTGEIFATRKEAQKALEGKE